MASSYLPVRERPLEGESLNGFVRRHIQAMGYDRLSTLLSLIEDAEIPADLNTSDSRPFLSELGRWLRVDEALLGELTVHRWTDRLVARARGSPSAQCDSKTLLRYFEPIARICPACLVEEPNRERLIWAFRPLGVCPDHSEILRSRCPSCRRTFSPRRLDLGYCRCGHHLVDGPAVTIGERPTELARRIAAWLAGVSFSTVALPSAAGFWWLDRLRSTIVRAPPWLARVRREWTIPTELGDESLAWLAAAALIEAWPAAFQDFLEVYQTVDKHLATSTGVGRSFGLLLRDADRLEQAGHPAPAETLRTYLLANYRRGHLTRKVVLFRSQAQRRRLRERPWLTQTEASRRLGVRPPTVADLVQRGGLVGEIRPAGKKGRTIGVVSADSVARLQGRLAETVTVGKAAEQLGIERHRVSDLIHTKILGESVRTARGWRITRASLEQLLSKVRAAPLLTSKDLSWLSLRETTRRFGNDLNLVAIVELVLADKFSVRRDPKDDSLSGLRFQVDELQRIVSSLRESAVVEAGYPLNRLARILIPGRAVKDVVLRKWIAAGLLKACRLRRAWQVSHCEVERFRATYCLGPDACRLLGVTRSTLARYEVEGLIMAIYGRRTHTGAGASVFLRADVERLAATRDA